MDFELLVRLVGELAWPIVVIVLGFAFRRQVAGLIERIREFEGPGDVKARFDLHRVERIVKEGEKANEPADVIAQRIIREAIVDERELRVLRALLGEENGRSLYTYQSQYYRPALESLLLKGLITKENKKYFLTETGTEAVRVYLSPLLTRGKEE